MKKILIDLQCLQTESANRGIGRYSRSFSRHLLQLNHQYDIHLLLNSALPNLAKVSDEFAEFIAEDHIQVFSPVIPSAAMDNNNWQNMEISEFLYESLVARENPDLLLICSLFEGFDCNIINSVSRYYSIPTVTIGYDLIPYHYQDIYLENVNQRKFYYHKLQSLLNSDRILAISAYVTEDISKVLNHRHCVNISTGADDFFSKTSYQNFEIDKILTKFNLRAKFVMYTGGIDFRKNIEGLIAAFAKLDSTILNQYTLAVVCKVSTNEKQRLEHLAVKAGLSTEQFVMTGFVSDDEMRLLYNCCSLFVFPSLNEGFGLPVLEAMRCGAVACCSDNSSLTEVAGLAAMLFDPQANMAEKMSELLHDEVVRNQIREHSAAQIEKFSWAKTAVKALAAIDEFLSGATATIKLKPRLAYASPIPPQASGIADYSRELLPYLAKYYTIDIITQEFKEPPDEYLAANFKILDYAALEINKSSYARIVYQFGNSEFHAQMYQTIGVTPGVAVLHDFFLSGYVNWAIGYKLLPFKTLEDKVYLEYGWLPFMNGVLQTASFVKNYPLNKQVLNNAYKVIFHSPFNLRQLKNFGAEVSSEYACIPLLRQTPTLPTVEDRQQLKAQLELTEFKTVFITLGIVDEKKLHHQIINAWSESGLARDQQALLIVVGGHANSEYYQRLVAQINQLAIANIRFSDRVDSEAYQQYLQVADVAIQLRSETRGETSKAILDCLAYALPVIVNAHGTADDLPCGVTEKISDKFQLCELSQAMLKLCSNNWPRNEMSQAVKYYLQNIVHPQIIAGKYQETIESAYLKRYFGASALAGELSRRFARVENPLPVSLAINSAFSNASPIYYIDVTDIQGKHDPSSQQFFNQFKELLEACGYSYRIEPFYLAGDKLLHAFSWLRECCRFSRHTLSFSDQELQLKRLDQLVTFNPERLAKIGHIINFTPKIILKKDLFEVGEIFNLSA